MSEWKFNSIEQNVNSIKNREMELRLSYENIFWIVVLTILMEGITIIFRFGFGYEATRDTKYFSVITLGFRIHHGYIGIILVLFAAYWLEEGLFRIWAIRIGWALIASDLIHHFLVLWPITGDPQFHLRYPKTDK